MKVALYARYSTDNQRDASISDQFRVCRAYAEKQGQAINTMSPSSLGYTANALNGGSNGANQLVKTGNLNLQHGTIQTRLGGDISIFGPGGNILVGPLGLEPNANLKLIKVAHSPSLPRLRVAAVTR
jgi:hypothetical protein